MSSISSMGLSSPNSTYYPCRICLRQVTWDDRALLCESCNNWFHIDCQNIHSKTYDDLDSNSAWICTYCKKNNYFYEVNLFSPIHLHSSNPELPIYTSSPVRTVKSCNGYVPKNSMKNRFLRIINVNCQSLRNKPEQLQNLADSFKPDVIIGTESWLTPIDSENGVTNCEIFPDGYKLSVARRDRQEIPYYSYSPKIRGRGTFILLKDDLIGIRQVEFETNCEITWIKFEITGCKVVYVASYYRPHENDEHSLQELEKSLNILKAKAETGSHIWIGGDFNFPGYGWADNCMKSGCNQPDLTRRFVDLIDDNDLTQMILEPTYYNENTLDLFLTNTPSLIYSKRAIPGISSDGHHAVCVECEILSLRKFHKSRKIYLFQRADLVGYKNQMESFSNSMLSSDSDIPVNDM